MDTDLSPTAEGRKEKASVVQESLFRAFSHLLHHDDKDEFLALNQDETSLDAAAFDPDASLEKFDPAGLSKNRRLLLAGYLVLYNRMRADDSVQNNAYRAALIDTPQL